MSVAEQAIITYCQHLLPIHEVTGEVIFDIEKVEAFMPFLDEMIQTQPDYQYLAYIKAKLLLAMGPQEHMLSALPPFAKRKRNDFWVWELMSEAFSHDEEKTARLLLSGIGLNSLSKALRVLSGLMVSLLGWWKTYMFLPTK